MVIQELRREHDLAMLLEIAQLPRSTYYYHSKRQGREPVVEFFNGERGKMLITQLQQVLGKVRKEEKFIEQRTYAPKILSQEAFDECQPFCFE